MRQFAWVVLVLVVVSVLSAIGAYAACASQAGPATVAREADVPGISGQVTSLSDVATIPDVPLPGLLVFAVPADQFPALLAAEGVPADAINFPETLGQLNVSAASWQQYVVASGSSDGAGSYHLDVAPGAYHVCIANLSDRDPSRLPASVAGCTRVDVGADGTRLDLQWGLQGLVPR